MALGAVLVIAALAGDAMAGASILEPAPARRSRAGPSGFDFGIWASSSQPVGDSRDVLDRTIRAGATWTWTRSPGTGTGFCIDYCRWPSPAVGAAFDRLFSIFTEVHGTEVTISAVRATGFGRLAPLPDAPLSPWIQFGAGVSRTKSKIVYQVAQMQDAGWTVHSAGSVAISYDPMIVTGLGLDLRTTAGTKIGVDVMWESILPRGSSDPVTSVTVGGHVLFGRWPRP